MSEKFSVEIISPDKLIFKTDALEVVVPSYEGEIGILKDHIPLITFLRPGIIKILDDTERKFFAEEGIVEFVDNNLLILTSTLKKLSDLDKSTIENLVNDSQEKLEKNEITDKEKYLLSYKIETLKNINL